LGGNRRATAGIDDRRSVNGGRQAKAVDWNGLQLDDDASTAKRGLQQRQIECRSLDMRSLRAGLDG